MRLYKIDQNFDLVNLIKIHKIAKKLNLCIVLKILTVFSVF